LQTPETEWIVAVREVFARLFIETLRMMPKHFSNVHRERAVHKDRNIRHPAIIRELVQQHDQLLHAAHRKGRHDDFASPARRCVDHSSQLVLDRSFGFVKTPTIGALYNQIVGGRHRVGIADDRQVGPSHVSRVGQPHAAPVI